MAKSNGNSFLSMFIPNRRDTLADTIRKYIFILSVVVIIVGGVIILCNLGKSSVPVENGPTSSEDSEKPDSSETPTIQAGELTGSITLEDAAPENADDEKKVEILPEFADLYKQNSDLIGWIRVPNTPIDYPVMQTDDNKYYLYRDFNKNDTKEGSIIADCKIKFTETSHPANTILYGHNIANGTYFAKVTNYNPTKYGSLDFYKENPVVYFDTLYEKGAYKVFAGMFVNTQEKDGEVFSYYKQRTIKNEEEFYTYLEKILDRSMFYTDVDLQYGDELLTLSTCYYPLGNTIDTRFVVFARRVRDGETEDVDVSKAYINKSPLMFDTYYAYNGGSWQGRNWDTTKLVGYDQYLEDKAFFDAWNG